MRQTIARLSILTATVCGWMAIGGAQEPASPERPDVARAVVAPLKLLFSGTEDISDAWGSLHFGVTPVRQIREVASPGFTFIGCFPLPDGAWEVFGQQLTETSHGDNPYDRVAAWKLVRGTTRDGVTFEGLENVLEPPPASWTDHCAMAFNPDATEYLLLKLKMDLAGFAYTAFFSTDGKQWQEHSGNPLFYEGDSMSLFWSPVLQRFVCVSKSLQPYRKHLIDHGGPTPTLRDDALRDRRVLMMRSSSDGRHWDPSVTLSDVWDRHGRKGSIPTGFLTLPDAADPPDLEFYSGNAFWYHDRVHDRAQLRSQPAVVASTDRISTTSGGPVVTGSLGTPGAASTRWKYSHKSRVSRRIP